MNERSRTAQSPRRLPRLQGCRGAHRRAQHGVRSQGRRGACRPAERHGFRRQRCRRRVWPRSRGPLRGPTGCDGHRSRPGARHAADRETSHPEVGEGAIRQGRRREPSPFRGFCFGRVVDRDRAPLVGHRRRATRSSPGARSRRPSRRHGAEGTTRCPRAREPWLDRRTSHRLCRSMPRARLHRRSPGAGNNRASINAQCGSRHALMLWRWFVGAANHRSQLPAD